MKENLWYLFVSGLLLGSGPCLSLCAPVLISYAAALRNSFKKSLLSYCVFSLSKLTSYAILGLLCGLGVKILESDILSSYLDTIYIILGCFIVAIGLTTLFYHHKAGARFCGWLHRGNFRNVGFLGLLIGFSPCLPLLGILNYIVMISHNPLEAMMFSLVFGLGTVFSPLLLLMMFSGKASLYLSRNEKLGMGIRILCGSIIVVLGAKVIVDILFH